MTAAEEIAMMERSQEKIMAIVTNQIEGQSKKKLNPLVCLHLAADYVNMEYKKRKLKGK